VRCPTGRLTAPAQGVWKTVPFNNHSTSVWPTERVALGQAFKSKKYQIQKHGEKMAKLKEQEK